MPEQGVGEFPYPGADSTCEVRCVAGCVGAADFAIASDAFIGVDSYDRRVVVVYVSPAAPGVPTIESVEYHRIHGQARYAHRITSPVCGWKSMNIR